MALLRKELRALRPFLWLILVIEGLEIVMQLTTEFPDQFSLADLFTDFDASFAYLILFAMAFAIGQTLIQREKSEETLEFIDSLPVSRARIYWTKWFAGFIVLSLYLIIGLIFMLPFQLLSLTSDDPSLYLEFWWPMLVMDLIVVGIYLLQGMALAFFGRFGLLAAAFYLIGVWILKESGLPGAERFDPLAFGQFNVVGSTFIVPWGILWPQLIGSVFIGLIGQFAFGRLGRSAHGDGFWKRAATPIFILGLLGAFIVWFVAGVAFTVSEQPTPAQAGEEQPNFVSWETTRAKTDHFIFIYPNSQAKAAEDLIAEADEIHDSVIGFLGAEPQRELVVDLTSASPRHAGTAYWGRIRMNLQAEGLESRLPAVLGHELCHIYIDQLGDNKVADDFNATRFFHEGLASLVEYRFFRPPEELAQIRRVAAAAHDREEIRFEDLVSSARLSEEFAAEWVYPLGEAFAAAIVDTWGDEAPSKLIRAFGRPDAPSNLGGIALWQDTFQAAGYDLETAIAAFFRMLDETVAEHRAWLDSLPDLRGQLITDDGGRLGIRIRTADSAEGGSVGPLQPQRQLLVRFRPGPGTPENEYLVRKANKNGTAWISREHFPGGAIDFQVVYNPKDDDLMMPIFGPWISTRVPN